MKLAKGKASLWVAERRGRVVYTRGGRARSPGVPKARELPSEEAAQTFLEAERDKRLAEGFVMIDEDAGLDTPFTFDGERRKRAIPARWAGEAETIRIHVRGGFKTDEELGEIIDELVRDRLRASRSERTAKQRATMTLEERLRDEALEASSADEDDDSERSSLGDLLREVAWRERAAIRAVTPPSPSVNAAIDAAFEALNRDGIVALQAAGYTMSDGWEDANEVAARRRAEGHVPRGACFFHEQDLERAVRGDGLMLAFGSYEGADDDLEVGRIVVGALRANGVPVEWDETAKVRIRIPPFEWYRRS